MQTEACGAGGKEKTRGGEEDRPGLQERPEHLQCLDAESKETGGKPSICATVTRKETTTTKSDQNTYPGNSTRGQSWVITEIYPCMLNRMRC